jgi:CRP-like cAMP-binding protein
MGRREIVVLMAIFASFGILASLGPAWAQEATPPAASDEAEVAPGVIFSLLPASEDPPSLYRLAFEPGAALYFAGDPAISLVFVESGAITLNMNAAVSDARAATPAGDAAALRMDQGDYFVLPPLVAGEIRNSGDEPASVVIAAITPGLFPVPAAGTPTAG